LVGKTWRTLKKKIRIGKIATNIHENPQPPSCCTGGQYLKAQDLHGGKNLEGTDKKREFGGRTRKKGRGVAWIVLWGITGFDRPTSQIQYSAERGTIRALASAKSNGSDRQLQLCKKKKGGDRGGLQRENKKGND